MLNATALKFAYPQSLIAETGSWTVQLRPRQPTLGALVLICKESAACFSGLSPAAFADLREVSANVERVLKNFCAFERINYLMLMMLDPDVHFHVLPRYAGSRRYFGRDFVDAGWSEAPKLGEAIPLEPAQISDLAMTLAALWQER